MGSGEILITKLKAGWGAFTRTVLPEGLNAKWPGLGSVLALGQAYRDQLASNNIELLLKELGARITNLEDELASVTDGKTAETIERVMVLALRERCEEKISFYAGIIAGELKNGVELDWDRELQNEFTTIISQLAGPELVILQAMHNRKRGEALDLPNKGGRWLNQEITMNETTLAWLDSLIKKGLVIDASVEKLNTGFGSPGSGTVKSRSTVSLSTFARSMIDYMLKVQMRES